MAGCEPPARTRSHTRYTRRPEGSVVSAVMASLSSKAAGLRLRDTVTGSLQWSPPSVERLTSMAVSPPTLPASPEELSARAAMKTVPSGAKETQGSEARS
jgi:hypothetical protein